MTLALRALRVPHKIQPIGSTSFLTLFYTYIMVCTRDEFILEHEILCDKRKYHEETIPLAKMHVRSFSPFLLQISSEMEADTDR
jgi:hypothetical protein